MIPFDFDYFRPESLIEAADTFKKLDAAGRSPVYYGGGTELISMARAGSIQFRAVIDLKQIPECSVLLSEEGFLNIGSSVTLTRIAESGVYPLLGETVSRIADHTIQDKITIGGNLAGTIIYREAALPLLLSECFVSVMCDRGLCKIPLLSIFDGRLRLQRGEFIVLISIDTKYLSLPYSHAKITKSVKIDYPLLSVAAIKNGERIRIAVCGLADYPMLLPEDVINNKAVPLSQRIENTVCAVQSSVISDMSGSREYRIFVLKNTLVDITAKLGVV